ncbi:MAG: tRNA (adenosine(37)-N6)-threonylcarbamoyltransferase complex transferase subunit TsaD [Phycisphaerales bacterium]|nr:tRNA (adenosine(37)-N6)-threonylcarbamoyltransferase complex transferase subunit TsaD [Phycisphaerales bacterium]
MLILGIETSCDETAAAVVRAGGEILSSVVASQHELHEEYAGVVPEIASRAHVEAVLPVVRRAVRGAGVTLRDLGAVAVGPRPGLVGSLLVGISAAKGLAWSLGLPLVGVDHVHAHLYAGLLQARDGETERRRDGVEAGASGAGTSSLDLSVSSSLFPALGLVVSGGHTSLYVMRSPIELVRVGATIDDALGEAFDKAATILGLAQPGGPSVDRLAAMAGADDRAVRFPIARLSRESLDMSFSGLKTSLLYAVRGTPGRGEQGAQGYERSGADLSDRERRDLAASFQRAAIDAVMLKVGRALERFEGLAGGACRAVLTGGGVTANSLLRARLAAMGEERGLRVVLPPMGLCVDNAAMIAGLAHHLHGAGRDADLSLAPVPTTAC